jgi:hypothetical protein
LNAERSVDDPIANSSQFTLPSTIAPAARKRSTTAPSYGGIQPSRIFEPAVVAMPLVTRLSLSAIGTPPSGPIGWFAVRLRSISAAALRASSLVTVRYALSSRSTFVIRAR